jgi:hypothetical protein
MRKATKDQLLVAIILRIKKLPEYLYQQEARLAAYFKFPSSNEIAKTGNVIVRFHVYLL